MAGALDEIPQLIEQGKKFTYDNFASKSEYGYPTALGSDWLVWIHEISDIKDAIDSATIRGAIDRGLRMDILGESQDKFAAAQASIVSGLEAAQKVFKQIPAADRIVSLGHNSQEQKQALQKIDELIDEVEQSNDFPGEPEQKELVVAELSAGRRLLQAASLRIVTLRATIQPALKWLAEKGASAAISKLAVNLVDYLIHLKLW